ncbi:uncharacterized protein LOC111254539 [Varroa destructor]|uniref:Uncharacterized protein n=2 Tax=Varroa TaxID=62624 RepID=A0A7M7KVE2_VARDE|nr:uncharacterized protein LOC111254539 [Varroa destructor]
MLNKLPELTIIYPKNAPINGLLNEMTHERGEPFRTHMEKNSKGVHISEIYNTETQDNLIRGQAVVIMDVTSIRKNVYRWCKTTKYFYYISAQSLVDTVPVFLASKNLPEGLNEAFDRKIEWLSAMDVPFMKFLEIFDGNDACIASRSRGQSETVQALSIQDIEVTYYTWLSGAAGAVALFLLERMYFVASRSCAARNWNGYAVSMNFH